MAPIDTIIAALRVKTDWCKREVTRLCAARSALIGAAIAQDLPAAAISALDREILAAADGITNTIFITDVYAIAAAYFSDSTARKVAA